MIMIMMMMMLMMSFCRQTRIFPSEALQRNHEEQVSEIVAKDKLNVGKIPMFKNALSPTATLCAYVKVDDLVRFLGDLVKLVRHR